MSLLYPFASADAFDPPRFRHVVERRDEPLRKAGPHLSVGDWIKPLIPQ